MFEVDEILLICDAFQRYVASHLSADGQLPFDAIIDVNDAPRDLPWLIGQLWRYGEPMPDALCQCLGLATESSYAKAAQFLSEQLRQQHLSAAQKRAGIEGLSVTDRQLLIGQLSRGTISGRDASA